MILNVPPEVCGPPLEDRCVAPMPRCMVGVLLLLVELIGSSRNCRSSTLRRTRCCSSAAVAAAELALAAILFLQASRLILLLSLSGHFLPRLGIMLAATTAGAAGVAVLQYKLVSTFPPTVLYTNFAAMPLTTQVLNMFFSTVAGPGGGACCKLAGLVGGGGSGAAADRLLTPGRWGERWLGLAADGGCPLPAILHPSWSPRGGGGVETPSKMYTLEPQPLARGVGSGLNVKRNSECVTFSGKRKKGENDNKK